jgi:alanyl-tRNA synthetase
MTDRLYYLDPYLRAFDATIERVEPRGDVAVVTLDRTAFYPSSGGQPFDTGLLGASRVVDVVDEEDGSVVHVVEHARDAGAPSLQTGASVTARSTGRGASTTCSSTPVSTSCPRPSITCSTCAR